MPIRKDEDMRIRPFHHSDTDTTVTLWEECDLVRPWNDPRKDIARKMHVQPDLFLVMEIDATVVATAMAGYDGHRGWVYYFAVAPTLQSQGLGRQLLGHVEERLTEMGCPKIQLQVRSGNTGTLAFYEHLGYQTYDSYSAGKRLITDH